MSDFLSVKIKGFRCLPSIPMPRTMGVIQAEMPTLTPDRFVCLQMIGYHLWLSYFFKWCQGPQMIDFYWIYDIPTWLLGVMCVATFSILTVICLGLSRRWIYHTFHVSSDIDESVNGFFAGVGVLLGLLMGLVAVAAWENYDAVEDVVAKEAANVSTIYRDVSTLETTKKHQLQGDLKEYLTYVVDVAWPGHHRGEVPAGGTLILTKFLYHLTQYQANTPEQQIFLAEVFSAYNKLIEVRRLRMSLVNSGLPAVFWVTILAGSFFSILVTFFFHMPSLRTHLVLSGIFSSFLGFMIFLLAAVDNPFRGEVSVSAEPYTQLLQNLDILDAEKQHFE